MLAYYFLKKLGHLAKKIILWSFANNKLLRFPSNVTYCFVRNVTQAWWVADCVPGVSNLRTF